eukprot:scaffold122683_cov48-Phaeocystis_antarctica.AAC.2
MRRRSPSTPTTSPQARTSWPRYPSSSVTSSDTSCSTTSYGVGCASFFPTARCPGYTYYGHAYYDAMAVLNMIPWLCFL